MKPRSGGRQSRSDEGEKSEPGGRGMRMKGKSGMRCGRRWRNLIGRVVEEGGGVGRRGLGLTEMEGWRRWWWWCGDLVAAAA